MGAQPSSNSSPVIFNKATMAASVLGWMRNQDMKIAPETDNEVRRRHRKIACCMIVGLPDPERLSKWGAHGHLKPQWLHAATSLHLMLRYPHLRLPNSFITPVVREGLESEYVTLCAEVLGYDPEGVELRDNTDAHVGGKIVTTEKEETAFVIAKDAKSSVCVDASSPVIAVDASTMQPL